jgi:cytochrome P450
VWRELRGRVEAFSNAVGPWTTLIEERSEALADALLAAKAGTKQLLQSFTVNLMGRINFGAEYAADSPVTEAFLYWMNHARQYLQPPSLLRWWERRKVEAAMTAHLETIGQFLRQYAGTDKEAWFTQLLEAPPSGEEEAPLLTRNELMATELDVFVYSLNNAFAVEYALFLLGVRESLQERLYEEVRGKTLNAATLHQMPLLMQVIKECNRAYPGGGGILSRQSYLDSEIDGKIVPAGVVSIVNSLLIHHDPTLYEDPNSFDPARWAAAWRNSSSLDAFLDDDRQLSYLTYGAGRKKCPGNRFAMMQQAVTLATLVKRMRFVALGSGPPQVERGFGALTKDGHELRLAVTKRQ